MAVAIAVVVAVGAEVALQGIIVVVPIVLENISIVAPVALNTSHNSTSHKRLMYQTVNAIMALSFYFYIISFYRINLTRGILD